MDAATQVLKFKEFIEQNYIAELMSNLAKGYNFLEINFKFLSRYDPELAHLLLDTPEDLIKAGEMAIEQFDLERNKDPIRIRFKNIPLKEKVDIRDIRSDHLDKFVVLDGVVRQKSDVRPQIKKAKFECPQCATTQMLTQHEKTLTEPKKCHSCGFKGKFSLINKELIDVQGITLEESTDSLEGGQQPKRLNILLKEDLVSPMSEKKTNPGSNVRVNGILKEVMMESKSGGKTLIKYDLILEANNVEALDEDYTSIGISKEDEKKIIEISKDQRVYDKLISSLAPGIYGHDRVKESILLLFLGGVQKLRSDGVRNRGDTHILLIGDPGSGKCITGKTKIILQDGEIINIENFANQNNCKNEKEIELLAIPSVQLNGALGISKVKRVWKRKEKIVLKIETTAGKIIEVTKEHPLFFCNYGRIIAKEAKDFKIGEFIATPRKINSYGNIQELVKGKTKYYNNSRKITYLSKLDKYLAQLLGFLCGDGYISKSKTSAWISFTNNDKDVLRYYSKTFKHSFKTDLTERFKGKCTETYILSKGIFEFIENNFKEIANKSNLKSIPKLVQKSPDIILSGFIQTLFECDSHVNKNKRQIEYCTISKQLAEEIQISLLRFGIISRLKNKIKVATNTKEKRKVKAFEIIIGSESIENYYNYINFISQRKKEALKFIINKEKNTNVDIVPNCSKLLKDIRSKLKLSQKDMGMIRSSYQHYEKNDRNPSRKALQKINNYLNKYDIPELKLLSGISNSDIFWDKIKSIKEIEINDFVYDLEVEKTHNFIANGIVAHNSQLLKRAAVLAPKGRYVSGKGASGAGLTASVVKDEFMGGWALEAGALVLANKGICMIDELDKMSDDDRSAMHEALEQQTVTISKANIQAMLKCETSVLAAANPKLGRFDPYESLAKQINLPPALISRFDLIFPFRDEPDLVKDELMASFILSMHKNSEVKTPDVDTELLSKYIVYARKNVHPQLTENALLEIKTFYVQMRNQNSDSDIKSIPITPRQLEALIRLTEASAKARLSQKATKRDAARAIDLLKFCLNQIGVDKETGQFDIDNITTGVTTSQRSKVIVVRQLLHELEEKIGKKMPIKEIAAFAEIKGIGKDELDDILEKLKRSGDIFEPEPQSIQRI